MLRLKGDVPGCGERDRLDLGCEFFAWAFGGFIFLV